MVESPVRESRTAMVWGAVTASPRCELTSASDTVAKSLRTYFVPNGANNSFFSQGMNQRPAAM
jgi:hypothetical protein